MPKSGAASLVAAAVILLSGCSAPGATPVADGEVAAVRRLPYRTHADHNESINVCWRVEGSGHATTALRVDNESHRHGADPAAYDLAVLHPAESTQTGTVALPGILCAEIVDRSDGPLFFRATATATNATRATPEEFVVTTSEEHPIVPTGWNVSRIHGHLAARAYGGDAKRLAADVAALSSSGHSPQGALVELLAAKHRTIAEPVGDTDEYRTHAYGVLTFFTDARPGLEGRASFPPSWSESWDFLAARDEGAADDRPGLVSWWDYGVPSATYGLHPPAGGGMEAHYELAAHLLTSRSEPHAIQILASSLLRLLPSAERVALVADAAPSLGGVEAAAAAVPRILAWEHVPMGLDEAVALHEAAESATGKRVRYVSVYSRLLPYDTPSLPGIDQHGILYALADAKGEPLETYVVEGPDPRHPGSTRLEYREAPSRRSCGARSVSGRPPSLLPGIGMTRTPPGRASFTSAPCSATMRWSSSSSRAAPSSRAGSSTAAASLSRARP